MTTLFAWTTPAYWTSSPVDHTWVTTYDNMAHPYATIGDVTAAGAHFWYCWGSFHQHGQPDRCLIEQGGSEALATCLVEPDQSCQASARARGTIFTYGVDGVCHQLSNQILYATGRPGAAPATVRGARGYAISSFLYGTYGLQHSAWLSRVQACVGLPDPVSILGPQRSAKAMADKSAPALPDDFQLHAREVLGDDREQLDALMALRGEMQSFMALRVPGFVGPTAAMLNERNQHMLEQAALLLGPERFEALFGVAPGERVELVDPEQADAQRGM